MDKRTLLSYLIPVISAIRRGRVYCVAPYMVRPRRYVGLYIDMYSVLGPFLRHGVSNYGRFLSCDTRSTRWAVRVWGFPNLRRCHLTTVRGGFYSTEGPTYAKRLGNFRSPYTWRGGASRCSGLDCHFGHGGRTNLAKTTEY